MAGMRGSDDSNYAGGPNLHQRLSAGRPAHAWRHCRNDRRRAKDRGQCLRRHARASQHRGFVFAA
eukprot:10445603-Lingulodinium_polyedra.AAC.1